MVSAVLLVKNAPDLAGVIGRELEVAGYRVIRAGDGETALRLYAQHPPDLVILDWISRFCINCGSLDRLGLDADGAKRRDGREHGGHRHLFHVASTKSLNHYTHRRGALRREINDEDPGHLAPMENPTGFNQMLRDFLASLGD